MIDKREYDKLILEIAESMKMKRELLEKTYPITEFKTVEELMKYLYGTALFFGTIQATGLFRIDSENGLRIIKNQLKAVFERENAVSNSGVK